MRNNKLAVVLIVCAFIVPIICIVRGVVFNQNCGGYLEQAANANSVELALERLNIAIEYVEEHDMTDGYTSVLWKTESDNIGYWYRNLKTCQEELEACVNSSQLEKTNVLLKVRESLTDVGEKGTVLNKPDGISRYPNNTLFGILNWVSLLMFIVGCAIFDRYW
jgi:hypothetical protein